MIAAAIPTTYAGVQFRSRLEAKWAAFFDRIGWPWQYEPIDLGGYIPDFILTFPEPLLVEVKPIMVRPDDLSAFAEAAFKIERTEWRGEALVLGAAPYEPDLLPDFYAIGVLGEYASANGERFWSEAILFDCLECRQLSVFTTRSHECRRCEWGSDPHVAPTDRRAIWTAWASAGNVTQWRARR